MYMYVCDVCVCWVSVIHFHWRKSESNEELQIISPVRVKHYYCTVHILPVFFLYISIVLEHIVYNCIQPNLVYGVKETRSSYFPCLAV
jgi:hypothetical protein